MDLTDTEIELLGRAARELKAKLGTYTGMTSSDGVTFVSFGTFCVFVIETVSLYPSGDEWVKKHEEIHRDLDETAAKKANETGEGKNGDDPVQIEGSEKSDKSQKERKKKKDQAEKKRRDSQEKYDKDTDHGKNAKEQKGYNEKHGK